MENVERPLQIAPATGEQPPARLWRAVVSTETTGDVERFTVVLHSGDDRPAITVMRRLRPHELAQSNEAPLAGAVIRDGNLCPTFASMDEARAAAKAVFEARSEPCDAFEVVRPNGGFGFGSVTEHVKGPKGVAYVGEGDAPVAAVSVLRHVAGRYFVYERTDLVAA